MQVRVANPAVNWPRADTRFLPWVVGGGAPVTLHVGVNTRRRTRSPLSGRLDFPVASV
jgi:hypothetical protein